MLQARLSDPPQGAAAPRGEWDGGDRGDARRRRRAGSLSRSIPGTEQASTTFGFEPNPLTAGQAESTVTIGLDQYAWPDPPRVYYASARNEGGTEVGVAQITVVRAPPVITVEQYRVLVDVPANGVETRTLYLNRALAGGYSGPVFLQPQVTDFAASGAFTVTLSENPVLGDAVDVVFKAGSVPPGGVSGRATLQVLAWRGTEAGGVPLDPAYRLNWPAFRVYVTSAQ